MGLLFHYLINDLLGIVGIDYNIMINIPSQARRGLTTLLRYNYYPISNYDLAHKNNPKLNAKFLVAGEEISTRIELFENRVPKTAGNYKKLLLGQAQHNNRSLSLAGGVASKVLPNAYVEFGEMEGGNHSIYGERFADESWEDLHDAPGLLSSISEGNTHNSRFLITLGACPGLDYKNVVFGRLMDLEILRFFEEQGK